MTKKLKKLMALLLALSMTMSMVTVATLAEEGDAPTGLCEHHMEHTTECGYKEAVPGAPCGHACSLENGCVTESTVCVHAEHDEECGGPEASEACAHVCSKDSGCVTESVSCTHPKEHDDTCGYKESEDAEPCKFIAEGCPECKIEQEPEVTEIASGYYASTKWTLTSDGLLRIYGTGATPTDNMGYYSALKDHVEEVKAIVVEDGITGIGRRAFKDCVNLTSVTIADSVTTIGGAAFENCTSLETIELPDSITNLGDVGTGSVFKGCKSLTRVNIPEKVTVLQKYLFEGCTALEAVEIPEGVTDIGLAFVRSGVKSITLPSTVVKVGSMNGSVNLTSFIFPEGITTIPGSFFNSCAGLEEFEIPDHITKIEWKAFENTGLKNIIIPMTVESIDGMAFYGCQEMQGALILGNPEINGYAADPDGHPATFQMADGAVVYVANEETIGKLKGEFSEVGAGNYVAYLNGGHLADDAEFQAGALLEPMKEGQDFAGWYRTSDFQGARVYAPSADAGEIYYAKWCEENHAHQWDAGVETTPATYDAEGVMTYTCDVCGIIRTEPIPVLVRPIPSTTYYTLTVNYVDAEGNEVAPAVTRRLEEGSRYTVESPAVEGMTPDQETVAGILNSRTRITVVYTAVEDVEGSEPPLVEAPEVIENPEPTESQPPETEEPDETEEPEELNENSTPLTETPDGTEELGENDIPLAEVPQTGDMLWLWVVLTVSSAAGLIWLSLEEKKGRRVA